MSEADIQMAKALDSIYRELYTFEIREAIGKTEDRDIPLCMHSWKVAMEMANKGAVVCRVCSIPLPEGVGRYNDHLLLGHPYCVQPICMDCARDNPDVFHRNFKRGVNIVRLGQLYVESDRIAQEWEDTRNGNKMGG